MSITTNRPVVAEPTLNEWVAQWLNGVNGRPWQVTAQELRSVEGSREQPDLIVRQPGRMPAVVEFEYGNPAVNDALSRIGKRLKGAPRELTEVLAVGYAETCQNDSVEAFHDRLASNEVFMSVQIVSRPNGENARLKTWPDKPLPGNASDLMALIEYLQVPQAVIDEQSKRTADEIKSIGQQLHEAILMSSAISDDTLSNLRKLTGADHVGNSNGVRNRRNSCPHDCGHDSQAVNTACAIWLVAFDLQNDLAKFSESLQARGLITSYNIADGSVLGHVTASSLLPQWQLIADVNYLPVIELGISCLRTCTPIGSATTDAMERLIQLSDQINTLQTKHVYNFAGELWQELVHDRDERAAHYTKPHIAELLATLACERFTHLGPDEIGRLNLLDAACGTGTLIGAGERAIRRLYWDAGGRDTALHRSRMENHIFAMDVNGIAGTLTAKRLTDMNLEQDYTKSQIAVITHAAGSLILLDPGITGVSEVLGYKGVTPTTGPGGDPGVFHVADGGIDWALMNPPFSRPRGGRRQATTGLQPYRNAAKRRGYTMSHGGAGLATDFGDLSNIRLRRGGVFAHVLPLTAARADSWTNWRRGIEKDFTDIVVVASPDSMSADTTIDEILVIATKRTGSTPRTLGPRVITCVNLDRSFTTLAEGYSIAREVARIPTNIDSGLLSHGTWSRLTQSKPGNPWVNVGGSSRELAAVVANLVNGQMWNPDANAALKCALKMSTIGNLCDTGPTHHLIGHPKGANPIGAFEWSPIREFSDPPAQQSLWVADGHEQTTIQTAPTHGGIVIDEASAAQRIEQRSRWFVKRGLAMVSQSTAIAHTLHKVHGGRAWTALLNGSEECMRALALFHNSTFGALLQNAYGSIQQPGRAQLQVGAINGLYCPAFNEESPEGVHARAVATRDFDELSELELKPFAYCFVDPNRHKLDNTVAEMLGLDAADDNIKRMMTMYRLIFARQKSVHGGSKSILDALRRFETERGLR